jgi:hypothetical protein
VGPSDGTRFVPDTPTGALSSSSTVTITVATRLHAQSHVGLSDGTRFVPDARRTRTNTVLTDFAQPPKIVVVPDALATIDTTALDIEQAAAALTSLLRRPPRSDP